MSRRQQDGCKSFVPGSYMKCDMNDERAEFAILRFVFVYKV